MKKIFNILSFSALVFSAACTSSSSKTANVNQSGDSVAVKTEVKAAQPVNHEGKKPADAVTILARKQVPILCYHQIRDWKATDSQSAKDYIIPVKTFKDHVKMLADSGYNSILPDQLYNYLVYGDPLPAKPVMFTFDDTDYDQFEVGAKELKKYGFKGVYFIMTVSIGRNGKVHYMSKEDIKALSDDGNVIGSHTYDHKNVKKYVAEDWVTQIEKPSKKLEEITGKKMDYFAYPFGLWNKEAIPELKKRGFKSAFILAEKRDENDPLYTIRRIIASGYWSSKTLHNSMVNSFGEKRN
ncbi:polysaccharide deacetylase family protein [Pedobacter cryophilus]|uniref:Polysaccharide deacetylase family protein n=1 Tax=Pedobacter cryophilus TaxID=2571271 RepID=A0A4U1BW32_9SPHI|nr:polysaccharide deacetylase family protein [Pedobacter cryophilus]TKB97059.1 polysaccharide deacetylase family protein [Pedobacter cryophilus]